jgi:hypothetical protein
VSTQSVEVESYTEPIDVSDIQEEPHNILMPTEKMLLLHRMGYSYQQIADQAGCTKQAVWYRVNGLVNKVEEGKLLKDVEDEIQDAIRARLTKSLLDDDLEKVPYGTKALAYCQIYDKHRLQIGQSTENQAIIHQDIAAIKGMK